MAGTVTMKVLAPAPSRCATDATAAVPSAMRTGSVPTSLTSAPDDRIEQAGIVHDAEVDHREGEQRGHRGHAPDPVHRDGCRGSRTKPPISAAATGTSVSATSTDVTLNRIRSSSAATVPIPSRVSMLAYALRTPVRRRI